MTTEERASYLVRTRRNRILFYSDWTQLADCPLSDADKQAWSLYRNQLRDITNHTNFPFLQEDDWPVSPDGTRD